MRSILNRDEVVVLVFHLLVIALHLFIVSSLVVIHYLDDRVTRKEPSSSLTHVTTQDNLAGGLLLSPLKLLLVEVVKDFKHKKKHQQTCDPSLNELKLEQVFLGLLGPKEKLNKQGLQLHRCIQKRHPYFFINDILF
ncbi:hypothetical protein DGG96_10665 [Legionella qingyii]|uniref:Uncharacterized protein n=1 Tax=Legionella qingyii TaxID=2184757 RepID=A0A317U516_9GAMM|nr:hypothetical protein DGG96_10665 [Legionella qingyii]